MPWWRMLYPLLRIDPKAQEVFISSETSDLLGACHLQQWNISWSFQDSKSMRLTSTNRCEESKAISWINIILSQVCTWLCKSSSLLNQERSFPVVHQVSGSIRLAQADGVLHKWPSSWLNCLVVLATCSCVTEGAVHRSRCTDSGTALVVPLCKNPLIACVTTTQSMLAINYYVTYGKLSIMEVTYSW